MFMKEKRVMFMFMKEKRVMFMFMKEKRVMFMHASCSFHFNILLHTYKLRNGTAQYSVLS